jgi:hypothetical protein
MQSCFARCPHLRIEIWGTRHPKRHLTYSIRPNRVSNSFNMV